MKHLLILFCASNQLLNVIRMFPLCNMFIHTTLNITFYFIALQQNSFCWFWLIWNQHFNSFLSYPSLQNSTQSWVSWGSSESPAETVKPFLLQTNMAHSSRCSLSFQIFFLYGGYWLWIYSLYVSCCPFFIVSCSLVFQQFSLVWSALSSWQGTLDIRQTQRLDLRMENTHFTCQYQEVKAWLVSMTQLALFYRCCNYTISFSIDSHSNAAVHFEGIQFKRYLYYLYYYHHCYY